MEARHDHVFMGAIESRLLRKGTDLAIDYWRGDNGVVSLATGLYWNNFESFWGPSPQVIWSGQQ